MRPFSSPLEIKNRFPLPSCELDFISESRRKAIDIFHHKDPRLICIVGPCSIHDTESALEYARRLKSLSRKVENSLFLIMRVYCEKSRSQASWKGLLYDPDLDGSNDLFKGIIMTRQLLLELARLELPSATEFLDPLASKYYSDLITWGFIGARTSASLIHRQMASSFDFPIGFKNDLLGEIDSCIHGISTARTQQSFLGIDETGMIAIERSCGNPYSHLVLRGSLSKHNHDPASIQKTLNALVDHHLEKRVLIDCSHGNSGKDHRQQAFVFQSILHQIMNGNDSIMGFMLESHLEAGKQPHPENTSQIRYGVSITDSCIGWDETEELLLEAAELLSPTSINSVQK